MPITFLDNINKVIMKKTILPITFFMINTLLYQSTPCMEVDFSTSQQPQEDVVMADAQQPQLFRCTLHDCGLFFDSAQALALHCRLHTAELRAMAGYITQQQMQQMVLELQLLQLNDAKNNSPTVHEQVYLPFAMEQ